MRLLPEARNNRFMAIVLLLIVLLIVYVGGVTASLTSSVERTIKSKFAVFASK